MEANKNFRIQKKNLNELQTDVCEKGKAAVVTAGGLTFHMITMEPGYRWSKHMKPLAKTESCQNPHVLYVISGRFRAKMDDGKEEEFGSGDIGVMPPGHDVWTIGDKPAVLLHISH